MINKIRLKPRQKALIIGDIHGCYNEMLQLISASGIDPSVDYVISLGDIVDRGPDALPIVDYFTNNKTAIMILGNHEMKHIRNHKFNINNIDLNIQKMLFNASDYSKALSLFKKFPIYLPIYAGDKEYLVVHAAVPSNINLDEINQFIEDFDNLTLSQKILTGVGSFSRNGFKKGEPPTWFKGKSYPIRVIFGHIVVDSVIIDNKSNVMGIDTGCVLGGYLTGVLLPEEKIIQVKSAHNYDKEVRKKYLDEYYFTNYDKLDWKIKNRILDSTNLKKCRPIVTKEYRRLSTLYNKINEIASSIMRGVGRLTDSQKQILGYNWSSIFEDTGQFSNEIKKSFFAHYEIKKLFRFTLSEIKELEELANQVSIDIDSYIDKFRKLL